MLQLFIQIALLRSGPQDLPASSRLLGLTLVFALLAGTLALSIDFLDTGDALVLTLLDMGLASALLWGGLWLTDRTPRFAQAATAWFGCGALVNLAGVPVTLLIGAPGGESALQQAGGVVYLALIFWTLAIGAHILRHTFEVNYALGVVMSVGYFLLINLLVSDLLGAG